MYVCVTLVKIEFPYFLTFVLIKIFDYSVWESEF